MGRGDGFLQITRKHVRLTRVVFAGTPSHKPIPGICHYRIGYRGPQAGHRFRHPAHITSLFFLII